MPLRKPTSENPDVGHPDCWGIEMWAICQRTEHWAARLFTLPPFAKCAKDGAPDHLWQFQLGKTKGGPPANSDSVCSGSDIYLEHASGLTHLRLESFARRDKA